MIDEEMRDRAIKKVKEAHPDGTDVLIRTIIPEFFGGSVAVVDYKTDRPRWDTVFIDSHREDLYTNLEAFLRAFAGRRGPSYLFLDILSGAIALLVTLTICYLVVRQPNPQIPEVLSGALTLILGFYFGSFGSSQVAKRSEPQ